MLRCYAATLRSKLDVDQVLMLFCFPAAQAQAVELGKLGVKELKDTMPRHVCLFQNDIRSRKSNRQSQSSGLDLTSLSLML